MDLRARFLLVILFAGCGGGDDFDDGGDADADSDADTDSDTDTGTDTGTGTGSESCGEADLPVGEVEGTEGIAIAPDGTLYYSQASAVGRVLPGGTPENAWVTLAGASTVWGLVLTEDGTLYVGSPSTQTIYRIDTSAPAPVAEVELGSAGGPNGLALAPDGTLYYSDFGGDAVYRVESQQRYEVTTSAIESPNGILFDDEGRLLVLAYSSGDVLRLTLSGGVETGREPLTTVSGNPDGIGIDDLGRLYVTDNGGGGLIRIAADFGSDEVVLPGVSSAAGIAFGRGVLRCTDVYVASGAWLGLYHGDATGRP